MTIDEIEGNIRQDHGGAWWGLFHKVENGHQFLPTGYVLSPASYDEIKRRFGVSVGLPPLTPEERKRNAIRAKADVSGERYGR